MAGGRDLYEELIVEILLKLPVKSLLRSRCVCKCWFDLIKSPNFVKKHLDYHKNIDNFLILHNQAPAYEDESMREISFRSYETLGVTLPNLLIDHFKDDSFIHVCGPCDGLICITNNSEFLLCNPAMREFKLLPPHPLPCVDEWEIEEWGINEWECEGWAVGFGFDSNSNDYKVIYIADVSYYNSKKSVMRVVVYSLSSDSWKEIDCDVGLKCHQPDFCGKLLNGTVYWNGWALILCFDLNDEVFNHMELPPIDIEERKNGRLEVLYERIGFLTYNYHCNSSAFEFVDIWVMHDYGVEKLWRKILTVGPMVGHLNPLLLWKNEAVIVKNVEEKLFAVDLRTQSS